MGTASLILVLGFLTIYIIATTTVCNGINNDDPYVLVRCKESEKRALLSFKQDLVDRSNRLSSWDVVEDCCKWAGVVCDNLTGHVIELHLRNPDNENFPTDSRLALVGEINPSLLNLKHLSYLDLSQNYFRGVPIPSFIGSLVSLQYLNLSNAGFGGTIPGQLGNLTSLRFLSLEGVYPFRIDVDNLDWLPGLSLLEHLDLSTVNLSKAPNWLEVINKLPSLVELHLSYCELDHINIFGVVNFTSLAVLDLSGNNFGSLIPKWIFSLSSLISLDLSSSNFLGCPEGSIEDEFEGPFPIVNFTSLAVLDFSSNNFSSLIPIWIFSLSSLISLDLRNSYFLGWPEGSKEDEFEGPFPIVNFTSLAVLDLSGNNFSSLIPKWIFSLSSLISLDLSNSNFLGYPEGSIEDEFEGPFPIVNFTSLAVLDLSGNNFSSLIPKWIFSLSSLISLDLSSSNFLGCHPIVFQNMTSLRYLDISRNELEGRLPRSLENLCNLTFMDLSYNKFSAELFNGTSKCPAYALESLLLYSNQLSGHIPNQLEQFKNLRHLDLGANFFSGPIPMDLGRLTSLEWLYLARNQLNGTLPESLGNLSKLQELFITDNFLEGIVSEVHFTNLSNLRVLLASENRLTLKVSPNWVPPFQLEHLKLASWHLGPEFPTWIQSQKDLVYLDLSSSGISLGIPTWFWNLTSSLQFLNLSHNQIFGGIPYILAPSEGQMIYLSSNRFNGSLPRLSSNLIELDLSNNSFSGSILHFLCDRKDEQKNLAVLDLGNNLLSGEIPDCWMSWESLRIIEMGNNKLTRNIPSSMGLLEGLRSLHLRNNHLSGEISLSLRNCTDLVAIDLSENEFTGNIPTWMGERLSYLRFLNLGSNKLDGVIPPQLCGLSFLQILDLAHNNLFGAIPWCIGNFTAMAMKRNSSDPVTYEVLPYPVNYFTNPRELMPSAGFLEHASLVTKGNEYQYDKILGLVAIMDLSDNSISGEIPEELTSLVGLISLNLSGNHLTGVIPKNMGNMGLLGSLDLSRNQLRGEIPQSMSGLDSLGYLNLSYNNLSGKIPPGTKLEGFNASSFIGNKLCGLPLANACGVDGEKPGLGNEKDDEGARSEVDWLYLLMALGFGVGFWAVCVPILLVKSWRYAYFRFLDDVWTRVCVYVQVNVSRLM